MLVRKSAVALGVGLALGGTGSVWATNGMNLEGYGPVASAMGGASMAYDNGSAAVMNNPATLGLMEDGDRFDAALGMLGPDVSAEMPAMGASWGSDGDSYYMPAVGWVRNRERLSYGVGMFAQGGMGTEYPNGGPGATFSASGALGFTGAGDLTNTPALAAQIAGTEERSEVGVARLIFPIAYEVNDDLNVGGSLDWVRASMDVKMVMPGASFANLVAGGRVDGTLLTSLNTMFGAGQLSDVYAASLDFSDDNDYDGQVVGSGFAGKLGVTYRVNPKLTVGATYHSKTSLDDLDGSGSMAMFVEEAQSGLGMDIPISLTGDVTVIGFEWPETYALGLSYQANDRLMIAADVKKINWSEVMQDFTVRFRADNSAGNQAVGLANQDITIRMPQNWDDQTVIQIGASYAVNEKLVLRGGINAASNPVPDDTLNYLFPAIIERHYTVGFGYGFTEADQVNFALMYAPEVTATGSGTDNAGLEVSHSQTSWQVMYSRLF